MLLREILQAKGNEVFTISPNATLADVVQQLNDHNCGSLVVCSDNARLHMVGIITERDILKACAKYRATYDQVAVSEVMTRRVHTAAPGDSVDEIMGLMTERRVRHLPIIENGRLAGLVSIGDVVKAKYNQLSAENHYLKNYIQS